MTTYTVGLRILTRTKALTIEAEDALLAALKIKLENPRHSSRTFASRTDAVIVVTHMRRCRIRK